LGAADAALVGACQAQVQGNDRIHDEMDHVTGRDPVAKIGRQEQWRVMVNVDKAGGHSFNMPSWPNLFREFKN
jgi:hypothetical protein